MDLKNWKKIKHSSSFRRKITKNFNKILNSVPSNSKCLSKNNSVNNSKSHSSNSSVDCHEKSSTDACLLITPEEVPCQSSNDIITAAIPCNTEHGLEQSDDNEHINKWLVELDDDNLSIIHEEEKNEQLRNDLKKWACDFNITQRALKELIGIVNIRLPNILPVDPRTLLGTPTTIIIQEMGEGHYWHQGLEFCLNKCQASLKNLSNISININMDGLPIYKSSKDEFWPILFNIFEVPKLQPMVIGMYSGKGKPSNVEEFLTPFVEDTKPILENGIILENGQFLKVRVRCFISDSPARAFIKGVTNFNGQHGCLKCTTIGEYSYISHCNIFPRIGCPKRTDHGFRSRQYGSHHKCYTPLENLPIDMVDDFPVADSLHLIDLGVMKRCLMGWRDGSFRSFRMKWSARDAGNISTFLHSCKMPLEIHRAVRGLDCLSQWKGLEYRTFLHYIGIVILKEYLPYDVYEHFLLLFCAITICSSKFHSQYITLAEQMLLQYIEHYKEIYGEEYITSNVHNLSHLIEDIKRFGVLSNFSSYPFESKLYHIKNLLRNARNPLTQVAKRLSEKDNIILQANNVEKKFPVLKKQNDGEEITVQSDSAKFFYQIEVFDGLTLNNDFKNKWFLTNDNEIVNMKNIIFENENILIYGSSLKHIYNFFDTPIRSSYLNIYASDCEENIAKFFLINSIKCKLVCIKKDVETFVFIPLLHTL